MYSSVQAFADDMSALRSGYDEHASSITATDEAWFVETKEALWSDFARRATGEEEKIRNRVTRGSGEGDGRSALLGAISGFTRAALKKADTNDKSGLIVPDAATSM
ncbi:GRAM domain containing protein [Acanthamoeba castellanii str. Neff]|uniref:GRAM domain containing protein n=1 Tax=Acanthamoeba castellanii (strain ATCC 30010 / Neff) TaxID=1257118 RepID=L8GQ93_ACACF|nr:GRAM domain containing protein [Acanthamoeba castellanii str. Neff]ELR14823.1 GRAM domain containing protein [Acanthamoeba castellanii str. Neff]